MCARVSNQRIRGVVTARVRTDAVQSLRHQRRDLHQSIYPVPLRRSGLILLSQGGSPESETEAGVEPVSVTSSTPVFSAPGSLTGEQRSGF
jgi:hypothetical protein